MTARIGLGWVDPADLVNEEEGEGEGEGEEGADGEESQPTEPGA
jgi:hypothetical protein